MEHMFKNELFFPLQYGFLWNRSYITWVITVLDDWTRTCEDGGNVDNIYLDFQKAFDSVPHEHLLRNLEGCSIIGKVLKYNRAFVKERRKWVYKVRM